MSIRRLLATFATVLAASFGTGAAQAAVVYQFEALSSQPFNGETFTGSFTLTVDDFITQNTLSAQADSCNATSSLQGAAACTNPWFLIDLPPDTDVIAFGVRDATGGDLKLYFHFDDDAFSLVGTHQSLYLGYDQAGTLTVSVVPEPSSLALMLASLAAVVGVRVRSSRQA